MIPPPTPECFAAHMGPMACEPGYVTRTLAAIKAGIYTPPARAAFDGDDPSLRQKDPYLTTDEGVAVLRIDGPLMKGWSKYGGTSTVATRMAIRRAVADPQVRALALRIDSPGGYIAGTHDLAEEVAAAAQQMPVEAYIEDLGASAAYWVAARARKISAGPSALVGSIGGFLVLVDSSGAAKADGVEVHVVQTGPFKAIGAPGAPVTPDQLAVVREELEDQVVLFYAAVREGRPSAKIDEVADGRVFIAAKAKKMGLVDRVESFDSFLGRLGQAAASKRRSSRARAAFKIAQAE